MAYGKRVNTDNLAEEEGILRDDYYRACERVRKCRNCDQGWTVETGPDGKDHQNWCNYCWDQLKDANREWRKVRDELRGAGVEVEPLDLWQKRLTEQTANRPTDPVGAEIVGKICAAWREYREGLITQEELALRL